MVYALEGVQGMAAAVLTISSRNYSSWSLRAWLLCKMAGLEVAVKPVSIDDPTNRAELLLLSPSVLVPRLEHEGAKRQRHAEDVEHEDRTEPDRVAVARDERRGGIAAWA